MELKTLRTLVAVAQHQSFVAAGEALGLTQSAVSLHIKALEEELGLSLFDRSRRPPELNADGRALVERAREILELTDSLTESFGPQPTEGLLSLGAVPTTITGILPPTLRALQQKAPRVRIRLTSGLSHELEGRVAGGELDAALLSEPGALRPHLRWHPVSEERLVVISPQEWPGSTDEALLTGGPYLRFRRHAWASLAIDAALRARGINPRVAMEIDSLEGIAMMVSHGLGASIVPERHIAEPFPPNVKRVEFQTEHPVRRLGVIERESGPRANLVGLLVAELVRTSRAFTG